FGGERSAGVEVFGHEPTPVEAIVPGPHELAFGCEATQHADFLGDGGQFSASEAELLIAVGKRKHRLLHPKPAPHFDEAVPEVLGEDLWTPPKIPMGMGVGSQVDQPAG